MREEVERTDGPPAQPIKKTDRKTKDEKLNNFPLSNVCGTDKTMQNASVYWNYIPSI